MADDDDRDRKLGLVDGAESDAREVYLPGGRTLAISGELVEIRGASGKVEVRILLTEQGPVLQMDAVRLELHADEAVEIASKRVDIKASEEVDVEAGGDVRVTGKKIWLN